MVKNICLRCGCQDESNEHITSRCRDSGGREMLQSFVNNLTGWLQKKGIYLALCRILCQYLMAQGKQA